MGKKWILNSIKKFLTHPSLLYVIFYQSDGIKLFIGMWTVLVAVSQIRWSMNRTNTNELKLLQRAIKTLQFCYFNTKSKQQGILTDFLKPLKHTISLFVLLPKAIVKEGNGFSRTFAGWNRKFIIQRHSETSYILNPGTDYGHNVQLCLYNRVKACWQTKLHERDLAPFLFRSQPSFLWCVPLSQRSGNIVRDMNWDGIQFPIIDII